MGSGVEGYPTQWLAPYGPPRRVIRGQNFSTDAVLSARDPNVTPLEHRLSNVEQGAVLGDPWFTGNDPFPNVPTTDARPTTGSPMYFGGITFAVCARAA